jgi:hypothetical protein
MVLSVPADQLQQHQHRVHRRLDQDTATRFQIPLLSSLLVEGLFDDDDADGDDDDEQMGVCLVDIIQKTLQDYNINYAGNEFVANAVDAGAKTFVYMLDERVAHVPAEKLLSREFARAHNRPALLLYNESCFERADFSGIRKVARGSKYSKRDGIGRFGLGALSLFYFTDVSVSNMSFCQS